MFYNQLHSIEAETANTRISVLIVSIIRLKLTVDLVNTTDITWESYASIMWW